MINFIRAAVRPYLAVVISSAVVGLATYLGVKFGDTELAKYMVHALVTAGVVIFGFYFGERAAKK